MYLFTLSILFINEDVSSSEDYKIIYDFLCLYVLNGYYQYG